MARFDDDRYTPASPDEPFSGTREIDRILPADTPVADFYYSHRCREARVDNVLIVGVETVVGANLAVSLSERFCVSGLSASGPIPLAECRTGICDSFDADAVRQWASSVDACWIIVCDAAANSNWEQPETAISGSSCVDNTTSLKNWAVVARELECPLTYISSDAVFTGPWMFHEEECTGLCASHVATAFRKMEKLVLETAPDAMVVRTNVFGWSTDADGLGWIERTLQDLESDLAGPFDYLRHATPILATDFVEILVKAFDAHLVGTYHIAGAERLNPNQFVERLADEFGLPSPMPVNGNCLSERPLGFGRGETSLHTHAIRKALGVTMPTIADGLRRLREQKLNGYCERLTSQNSTVHEKVA